jgi:hypothetical protein
LEKTANETKNRAPLKVVDADDDDEDNNNCCYQKFGQVFWHVTLCQLNNSNRRFGGFYSPRNVGDYLPVDTVQDTTGLESSATPPSEPEIS